MDKKIKDRVLIALDEIRPFLQADGGDVSLNRIEDTKVYITLEGTCTSCSINQMTLKNGVEATIKRTAPEITEVIDTSSTM